MYWTYDNSKRGAHVWHLDFVHPLHAVHAGGVRCGLDEERIEPVVESGAVHRATEDVAVRIAHVLLHVRLGPVLDDVGHDSRRFDLVLALCEILLNFLITPERRKEEDS